MCREILFEEENRKGKEFWLKVCRYILCAIMIGIAVFIASYAINAEGKENGEKTVRNSTVNRSDEYKNAVQEAVFCQNSLMAYAGMSRKEQRRCSMQIYRTAFLKEVEEEDAGFYWCNELGNLTMEAYGKLDEKGRELLTACQLSREQWKEAGDKRIQGSNPKMRELINRLYYQQLKYIIGYDMTEDKDI